MKKLILRLLVQLLCCFALSLAAFLLRPITWLYNVMIWAVLPLVGAASSYWQVRRGINPYIAWLMPPVAWAIAGLIASMGYLPGGAALALDILLCIIGAAAGDTRNKFISKGRQ